MRRYCIQGAQLFVLINTVNGIGFVAITGGTCMYQNKLWAEANLNSANYEQQPGACTLLLLFA